MADFNFSATSRRQPGEPLVSPPRPPMPLWMKWAVGLMLANFASFVLISAWLGGDALSGYASDGHYYLGWHKHYIEVTRNVYLYSKWHALSNFAQLAVAVFVARAGQLLGRVR